VPAVKLALSSNGPLRRVTPVGYGCWMGSAAGRSGRDLRMALVVGYHDILKNLARQRRWLDQRNQ
jgi:hypothetical protein